VLTIISGGQSGVDRAALDVAIELGIPYAGWCPLGGWAEDMAQPPGLLARYPRLSETPLADPAQRTEWNVRDADVVMLLLDSSGLSASRGTAFAEQAARRFGKPGVVVQLNDAPALDRTVAWLAELLAGRTAPLMLGIGGPRESEAPGIYERSAAFLRSLFNADAIARAIQRR
jgi:hypothetical protein